MARILHTADWQLGAPGVPPSYFDTALSKLRTFLIKNEIDAVLCVGDIFDQPHPNQKVKDLLLKTILSYNCQWVFTVGNHDYTDKAHQYHSLVYLQLLKDHLTNVFVLEPGEELTLWDDTDEAVSIKAVEKWESFSSCLRGVHPTIGCFHGIVPGLNIRDLEGKQQDACRSAATALDRSQVDYLALGDIHKHLRLNERCWYPGPLLDKTYTDTHGIVVVDISNDTCYVSGKRMDIPSKLNYRIDFDPTLHTEKSLVRSVKSGVEKGNFVKLNFNLPISTYNSIDQQAIRDMLADHYLEVRFNNVPVLEDRTRKEAGQLKKAKTIEDEIEIVVDTHLRNNPNRSLKKDKLIELCQKFVKEQR